MVLLNLAGTIPVQYREETYNIPGKIFLIIYLSVSICLSIYLSILKIELIRSSSISRNITTTTSAVLHELFFSARMDPERVPEPAAPVLRGAHQGHGDQRLPLRGPFRY